MSIGLRPWLRALFCALGLSALAAFVYTPLLRSGWVGSDYRALVEVTAEEGEVAESFAGATERPATPPLTRLSLRTSAKLWGVDETDRLGASSPFLMRLENLALLALASVGLAFFLRRLLLPWTGSEHAAAAAFASALILAFHPLGIAAVAGVPARGELIGLLLGVWSGAAFLRGRQDRKIGFVVTSFVLCALGGFASDLILGLPLLLMCAEFLSSHRYRSMRGRMRTTLTTLAVFGGAASLDLILHVSRLGPQALPSGLRALAEVSTEADLAAQFTRAIEKVGLLVLPSNFQTLGIGGTVLVGIAFIIAMQPALVAARTAPRLWSWFLFGWLIALAVTELLHAHVRVAPAELSLARVLLPSAAVMSVGLGIAATAVTGLRRALLPWTVAVAYAVVAHGNARPWHAASVAAAQLREEMTVARELHGADVPLFVLDPPQSIAGVPPAGDALAWLVHPALDNRLEGGPAGGARATMAAPVRGLESAAFLEYLREPEFTALLEDSVVVLQAPVADVTGRERRTSVLLRRGEPSASPRSWRDDLGSPSINLNALETSVIEVWAKAGTDLATLEEVTWTSTGGARKGLAHAGVWFKGRQEPLGIYDLGAQVPWRLSDRIRGIYFEQGNRPLARVEVREELRPLRPGLQAELRRDGRVWVFAPVTEELVVENLDRGRFVLALLDLDSLERREFDVEVRGGGVLRVRLPEGDDAKGWRGDGSRLAWTLEFRIGERAIARSRGRVGGEGN